MCRSGEGLAGQAEHAGALEMDRVGDRGPAGRVIREDLLATIRQVQKPFVLSGKTAS